jgi:signal transduction histidine kinase
MADESRGVRRAARRPERRVLSVRVRIVLAILVVSALGLVATGAATYFVQRERALSDVDSELLRTVPDLKAVAAGTGGSAPESVEGLLRTAVGQRVPGVNESILGFIDGKPALVPAVSLPFRMDKDHAFVKRIVKEANKTNVVMGTAKTTLGTIRYIIVPVSVAGDPQQGLFVAGVNLDAILGSIATSFQTFALVGAAALLVICLAAWMVAGNLLRPLRHLREAAQKHSATDLTQRIAVHGNDDISDLTVTINSMFDRLQGSFEAQRQLIDDVGHELKTPITIVRGHLELLDATDPHDVDATRALALDELDRMSELVSEVSLLADARRPDFVTRQPIDIEVLTESVLAKATGLASERPWSADVRAAGVVELDPRRVTQAWLQLADNAVKYSHPGGAIELGCEFLDGRNRRELKLWVRDDGPGIDPSAQRQIFDRFTRLPSARTATGRGLGLAIVAAIAEAHDGHVDVTSSPSSGSTFDIRLPVARIPAASEPTEEEEDR